MAEQGVGQMGAAPGKAKERPSSSGFAWRLGTWMVMAGGRKWVLVVDDDPDLRELMKLLLEGAGYGVETASGGKEALERVSLRLPSVVLLDMKMPGMNGWQFAEELRRVYERRVPIVVVTAAENARKTAAEIGAEGYLGKPFELDDVLSLVEHCSAHGADL